MEGIYAISGFQEFFPLYIKLYVRKDGLFQRPQGESLPMRSNPGYG